MDSNELPLSHGQRALWFLQRLRPEAAAWNIAAAARVRGQLDAGRLRRAFERLTERHDALRLSFHETPGGPIQRLHPEGRLDFQEAEWEEDCLQEEAERPFDLEKDPLLRLRLLRTGGDDVLLLVIHHLVADLGSLAVIVRELGPLYDGTFDDPPPVPYTAFVGRERLEERHWEYWRKRLAGELPVCELPADRPRPAVRSFRGGSRTRRMELAGSRMFPFLVAGLDVLLHRLSAQVDLLVGSPTSGRLAPELDGTVGYLVNPVVLRSDLSGSPTFSQLLQQVRGVVLGALRHQEYPFPMLVERLQPERDPARPPVFQVMLAFQRAHLKDAGDLAAFSLGIEGAAVRTGSLVLESLALERRFAELDLELVAAETSRGLELALTFNADLFEPATAERLLGHLETLLEAAAREPELRIGELPLLSPAERHQLLVEWNGASALPRTATVPQLVAEQAARTPDALAVLCGAGRLNYAELDARADALADRLLALGLRPETCAAVLAERSPDLVVALLAILKSGAAYAPLDPELPAERLAFLLEDLKPPVVLVQERMLSRLPACACDTVVVPIEADGLLPSGPPPARPPRLTDSLAYVLHTSGSTGHPKSVGVTHATLADHIRAAADLLELSERDRALSFASPAFDVSLEQILTALVRGAAVVLRGPDLWPPADFSRIAGELGLTVAELPTAYWRQWAGEPSSGAPPALRLVTAGGEAMPAEEARRWLQSPLAGIRLLNAYGPTEGVITATFLEVNAASASRTGAVALGRPLPGRRACILDLYGQLQPMGAAGELCLGGHPLARGYLGRPDLTAERFVPNPFGEGERLYRTGDLARWLPDGNLQFLGRIDRQVKIRGFRIELEEIEAVLRRHPGVREAVAAVRDGRLAAWYVPDQEEPSPGRLREWLRGKLPEVMVPATFVPLDALPLTPNGKIDRRALPDPVPATEADGAPLGPVEETVAEVWSSVLGIE
ncbi:MAG TPA: amino acid adenylation domain-containing protein, partial [Thermoanaerobaculia bacterium]|nr:amino acid adenylation domain-containing protein [Thermoanaerobaculia bacterium]